MYVILMMVVLDIPCVSHQLFCLFTCISTLAYYWGRITKIARQKGEKRYTILFHDGDITKNIKSTHFHRHVECIHMMNKQMIAKDLPPANL